MPWSVRSKVFCNDLGRTGGYQRPFVQGNAVNRFEIREIKVAAMQLNTTALTEVAKVVNYVSKAVLILVTKSCQTLP